MRVLHCSDVHITADYAAQPFFGLGWRRWIALMELRFGGRARAYAAARTTLAEIAHRKEQHHADHLILSGDLTAYALEDEFAGARAALGPLVEDPAQLSVIPGNHDRYTPGSRRGRFEKYFGTLLKSDLPEYCSEGPYPFVRLLKDEAAVVGLNSARAPTIPGFSFGLVGRHQLTSLKEILADSRLKHRAVLVAVHHAPKDRHNRPDRWLHGLWGADELLSLLPGPRFAVLFGHIHKRYHHPATADRPHLFGAGSSTQAGRGGYWVIQLRDGLVVSGEQHSI